MILQQFIKNTQQKIMWGKCKNINPFSKENKQSVTYYTINLVNLVASHNTTNRKTEHQQMAYCEM